MVTLEQERQAMEWLKQAYTLLGCPELLKRTEVRWETGMKKKLGMAQYIGHGRGIITLSVDAWDIIPEFERYDTVAHEACHIADHWFGSTKRGYVKDGKHGKSWMKLMAQCGLSPRAT